MLQEHISSISLHVETTASDILNSLLDLTWYHNDSVMESRFIMRYALSQQNKTLMITNSSADAGMYEVQFNQLFVHPYNEYCKEEILPLLRHYPVLSPAVFCVNVAVEHCSKTDVLVRQISIKTAAVDSDFEGTLNTITLTATGTVLNSNELRHSRILWYRNGHSISSTSLSPLKKFYDSLSISQELTITNTTYEDSGSFEVLLAINMSTYTQENAVCRPYYYRFISTCFGKDVVILAQKNIDIGYYKGIGYCLIVIILPDLHCFRFNIQCESQQGSYQQ